MLDVRRAAWTLLYDAGVRLGMSLLLLAVFVISALLVPVGAILKYAINERDVPGIDVDATGTIFLLAGFLGFVLFVLLLAALAFRTRRERRRR